MNKDKLVNLRINEFEYIKIKESALRFARGNVSLWLRFAAMNLKPDEKQLKKLREIK